MIRNFKVVLLWLCFVPVALPSSGMIQQSVVRQPQKPVRGTVDRPVQTQSDGTKPIGKTPATSQPIVRKQIVQGQPNRATTVTAGGPSIHIISPTFGVAVQSLVKVTGFVDNLAGGLSSVTVNGLTAAINDQEFSLTLSGLTTGQTQLVIAASDGSGNTSTVTQALTVDTDAPVWANISPEGVNAQWMVIAPSNPQILYASSSQLGIVKSTNGGKDWYRTGSGFYGALTVDPADPNIVYLVSGGEVLKSTDGGVSWTFQASLAYSISIGPPVMVYPFDSQHLMLARGDGAFESKDGGQTWRLIKELQQPITAFAFDPHVNGTIYAGGSTVFKSIDGGINWTSSATGIGSGLGDQVKVFGLYPDPLNPGVVYVENIVGYVYKTIDAAATWARFDPGIGVYGDIEFDNTQTGVFCIRSSKKEIFRTTDNGATWTNISASIPDTTSTFVVTDPIEVGRSGPLVSSVRIGPSSGGTIYATTPYGIFKSTDDGTTWRSANKNLYGLAVTAIASSKSNPQEVVVVTATQEIYKTVDGGQNWVRIDPPVTSSVPIGSITIDPLNPDHIFTESVDSTDGGKTWAVDIKFFGYAAFAGDPSNPNIRFGGDSVFGAIFRTLDGQRWKTVFVSPGDPNDPYFRFESPNIRCLAVNPKNPSIVYAGTQRSIYRSTDYGTTWTEVHRPESTIDGLGDVAMNFAIDPLHPNMIYAATSLSVLTSLDWGATWNSPGQYGLFLDPRMELRLDPNATNNFYVASFSATILSADRGHTWKTLPRDFAGNVVRHLTITNDNPSTVFGGSENGGISKLIPAVPKPKIAPGDVNRDGVVNVLDLSQLAQGLAGNTLIDNPQADLNHDGQIDVQDLMRLAQFLAGNITLQ